MTEPHRLAIRIFAAIDLPIVGCLALPGLAPAFMQWLNALAFSIGLSPVPLMAAPQFWLFVHVAGVLGVLWAIARLATPTLLLGGLDIIGRCLVTALIVRALVAPDINDVLWLFVASEIIGALVQGGAIARALRRLRY